MITLEIRVVQDHDGVADLGSKRMSWSGHVLTGVLSKERRIVKTGGKKNIRNPSKF